MKGWHNLMGMLFAIFMLVLFFSLIILLFFLVPTLLLGAVGYVLWNFLIAPLFGFPTMSFLKIWAIAILIVILKWLFGK